MEKISQRKLFIVCYIDYIQILWSTCGQRNDFNKHILFLILFFYITKCYYGDTDVELVSSLNTATSHNVKRLYNYIQWCNSWIKLCEWIIPISGTWELCMWVTQNNKQWLYIISFSPFGNVSEVDWNFWSITQG